MSRAVRTAARIAALALAFAAAACGGGTTSGGGSEGARNTRAPWLRDADDPTVARMLEVARRMREAGLTEGRVGSRGFVTARDHETVPIRIAAGRCLTIVALASRGVRDLDVSLFSPEGEVLAEDVEPDAHPTVQVCAGEAERRLYYSIHAYDGSGEYVVASFVGPRDQFAAAARIVGGRPGVASEDGSPNGTDRRLRELTAGVARRGFRPDGEPANVRLDTDQRVRIPFNVERGHCYTVAAFGMGVDRLGLRLLDEVGEELARGDSPADQPAVQLCIDRDANMAIEIHAVAGTGSARVAVFRATVVRAGGRNGLWLGSRRLARVSPEPVDERAARNLRVAVDQGWRGAREAAAGRLVYGEAVAHGLSLPAGVCTQVMVTGGDGLGGVSMRIVADDGTVLAARESEVAKVAVRLCPAAETSARAQLIARSGTGAYALHVLTRTSTGDDLGNPPAEDRGALLDAVEDVPDGWEVVRHEGRLARAVEVAEAPIRVPTPDQSGCVLVRAVASGAAGRVSARVSRGTRVAERSVGRVAEVHACRREGVEPVVELAGEGAARAWVVVLAPASD